LRLSTRIQSPSEIGTPLPYVNDTKKTLPSLISCLGLLARLFLKKCGINEPAWSEELDGARQTRRLVGVVVFQNAICQKIRETLSARPIRLRSV